MILHYSLAIWKINDNALSLIFFVNAQRSALDETNDVLWHHSLTSKKDLLQNEFCILFKQTSRLLLFEWLFFQQSSLSLFTLKQSLVFAYIIICYVFRCSFKLKMDPKKYLYFYIALPYPAYPTPTFHTCQLQEVFEKYKLASPWNGAFKNLFIL